MKNLLFAAGGVFIFAIFSACAAQMDDALVGTWHWGADGALTYTFEADGTGIRGFPEERQGFSWSTRRGRLNIDRNFAPQGVIREERWNYSIENGLLTLESRQTAGAEFVYIFAGEGEFAEELVEWGWEWDEDFRFVYVFRSDGTGDRGFFDDGEVEEITWFTNGTRLHIYSPDATFGVRGERWAFSVTDDVLTLQNEQWPEFVYTYNAIQIVLISDENYDEQ